MAAAGRQTAEVRAGQMAGAAAVPGWSLAQALPGEGWACAGELQLPWGAAGPLDCPGQERT